MSEFLVGCAAARTIGLLAALVALSASACTSTTAPNPPTAATAPDSTVPSRTGSTLDRSVAQVNAAAPLRAMPVVVLTETEPFQTTLPPPPGLPWEETNRLCESAQTTLVELQPNTPQIFATGSDHYIPWYEPDLVTDATDPVVGRAAR